MSLQKIKQRIVLSLVAFFLISLPQATLAVFKYTPMEEIPGFGRPDTYESYILTIYKFGLWTVGIAAVFMISIGAFMYITSAGNTSTMGKAKDIIFDSIIGVILALTSYVLLNTINPALVNINSLPQTGAAGTPGTPSGPSGTTKGYKKACPDPTSTTPIDFSKATNDTDIKLSSACDKYNFTNSAGVDPCLLRAMAQMESSCGANKGPSGAGACGLMQLLPSTAKSIDGASFTGMTDGQICEKLKNDDALSIQLAARYTSTNLSSTCVGGSQAAVFAGYNSGYGCTGSACNPKHALCPSGAIGSGGCGTGKAFECCISPGGLEESINYAWNGTGLYNQCKKR